MDAEQIILRPAATSDLPLVTALLRSAKLPVDGIGDQFGPAYVVAVVDDEIVGVEGIEKYGHSGLLRAAVVSEHWRGHGIGDRLTQNRLAWALEQQLREVWLLTETADRWFPRFGFSAADRAAAPVEMQASREFRDACPSSATAMRLVLSQEPRP